LGNLGYRSCLSNYSSPPPTKTKTVLYRRNLYGDVDSEPDPNRHVKISSFVEIVSSFSSIRRPFKLTVVGDNGRSYDWIIKYGEDLRQDQRIQQVSICPISLSNVQMCQYNIHVAKDTVLFQVPYFDLFLPKTLSLTFAVMVRSWSTIYDESQNCGLIHSGRLQPCPHMLD